MVDKLDLSVLHDFYKGSYPKTVTEYMQRYPPGYSRTVLKDRYGLTVSEVLKLLGTGYTKSNAAWTDIRTLELLSKLNLEYIGEKLPETITKRHTLLVRCKICSYSRETYTDSLRNQKFGCPNCAGCAKLSTRTKELDAVAEAKGVTVLAYPSSNKEAIKLQCNTCKSEYKISAMQFWYRGEGYGVCPVCHPTHSRKFIEDGHTFPSMVELTAYRLLLRYFHNFKLQVPYKEFLYTDRRFTADFVLPCGTVIEVGGMENNEEYHTRIEEKKALCYLNNVQFHYFYRVDELEKFLLERYSPL